MKDTEEATSAKVPISLASQPLNALLCVDFIDNVEGKRDERMARARVTFKNGLGLSIIRGEYSYAVDDGLYEIAPINKKGGLDGSFFDEKDQVDDVCEYCDLKKVKYYLIKIGLLTT